MKTTVLVLACTLAALAGCTEKPLENPTQVTFTQRPFTNIVDVIWQDNSEKELGVKYNLGVQAKGPELKLSSQIIYKNVELFDYSSLPRIVLDTEWTNTPTSVALAYTIENYKSQYEIKRYGLCWNGANMSMAPTVEDRHGLLRS